MQWLLHQPWLRSQMAIVVHYDSTYAVNMAMGEWTPKANTLLVRTVRQSWAAASSRFALRPNHVKSHTGNPGNEAADTLAQQAAQHG
eukprot:5264214-Karenia_brevis.AAC.1